MPLFAPLYPLTRKTTLVPLATADGDQPHVNVTSSATSSLCLAGMFVPLKVPADVVCEVSEPA